MNILTDLWRYAESTDHGPDALDGFDFLKNSKLTKNDHKECFAYISEEKDRVVYVFAGTKNNLKSWVKDFVTYPLANDSLINTKTGDPGIIHAGFYSIWEKSKKMVDDSLTRLNGREIFVTGMSQGGSSSSLCARHLVKNRGINKNNVTLVTYGAPAQGVTEYASQLNELLGVHFRVVDGYDIVPTMPPSKFGFTHGGSFVWLKVALWHRFFHRIRDHFYSSYTKGLMKKFPNQENLDALRIVLARVTI